MKIRASDITKAYIGKQITLKRALDNRDKLGKIQYEKITGILDEIVTVWDRRVRRFIVSGINCLVFHSSTVEIKED